jgi:hypothetical protein
MGTYTLENFRSELLFDLKNRSDTTGSAGFSTARQDSFINAGYLHVTHPSVFRHRELQHRYTIPLVNAQWNYTFTPNASVVITSIRSLSHVAAATDDPLSYRTKIYPHDEQWFQERTLTSSGPPRDYFVVGSEIRLSPVPTANEAGEVLVVSAWREPAVLIAGQTTVLSTIWDEIVLLAARWRAEIHLGYREMAEATKLDFTSLVNEYQTFEQLHGEDWDWQGGIRTESYQESA